MTEVHVPEVFPPEVFHEGRAATRRPIAVATVEQLEAFLGSQQAQHVPFVQVGVRMALGQFSPEEGVHALQEVAVLPKAVEPLELLASLVRQCHKAAVAL